MNVPIYSQGTQACDIECNEESGSSVYAKIRAHLPTYIGRYINPRGQVSTNTQFSTTSTYLPY